MTSCEDKPNLVVVSRENARGTQAVLPQLREMGNLTFVTRKKISNPRSFFRWYFDQGFDGLIFPNPYIETSRLRLYKLARNYNLPMIVFDRGGLPSSWFFDVGYNADSPSFRATVWDHPLSDDRQKRVQQYISNLKAGDDVLEEQGERLDELDLREKYGLKGKKVLFVPFQRPSDTVVRYFSGDCRSLGDEGVSSADQVFYEFDRVAELIREMLPDWVVVGKRHPLEVHTPTKNVSMVAPDEHIHALLEMSDAVLCLNSGVGLLATAFGKPVLTLGTSYYMHPKLTHSVRNADDVIVRLRDGVAPPCVQTRDRLFSHLIEEVYSFGTFKTHLDTARDQSLRRITSGLSLDVFRYPKLEAGRSKRKTCLFVSPTMPIRFFRGSEVRTAQMLRALGEAGYVVDFHVLNKSIENVPHSRLELEMRREFPFLRRVVIVNHPEILKAAKKPFRRFKGHFWSAVTAILSRSLKLVRKYRFIRTFDFQPVNFILATWRASRNRDYDLLYTNYAKMHMPWSENLSSKNSVIDTHDVQTQLFENERIPRIKKEERREFYRSHFEASERYILEKYDGVIAISSEDEEHFSEKWALGNKTTTIPVSMEIPQSSSHRASSKRMLFIGSPSRPNVSSLLWLLEEVFPLLKTGGLQLDIVGRVCEAEELESALEKGIAGPVKLNVVGHVASVSEAYVPSGIVLAPLVRGTGMKIKVIEALAYGKAVLGTPAAFQGIAAVPGEEALIEQTPESFAEALQTLVSDPAYASRLGEAGRALFDREFSRSATVAKLESFLDEIGGEQNVSH